MNCLEKYPEIARLLKGANHVDVKVVEGDASMRQFIASMLSYYPRWIILLMYFYDLTRLCSPATYA